MWESSKLGPRRWPGLDEGLLAFLLYVGAVCVLLELVLFLQYQGRLRWRCKLIQGPA